MRKKPIINLILPCGLFTMSVLIGCVSQPKREVVYAIPERTFTAPLSSEVIDKKITFLNERIEMKTLNPRQEEVAQLLLSGLDKINKASKGDISLDDYHFIITVLFDLLSRLEEEYFLGGDGFIEQDYVKVMALFSNKRKEILDSYLTGDFQGVIIQCMELESTFGPDSLTPEIGLLFALSLAEKGMYDKALNIGDRIMPELDGKPDLVHLRAGIIEWLLATKNKDKAAILYERLIDTIDEREAVFNRIRQKIAGDEPKIIEHEIGPSDEPPTTETHIHKQLVTIEDLLNEVDRLVRSNSFDAAKLLLIRWKLKTEEGPDMETIDQALKAVELAEEKYRKREVNDNKKLEIAINLIEKEDFEGAIKRLDEIKDNSAMAPESERLKDLAVERLINRERDRAAKIYLMAKQNSDPRQRQDLLMASYTILKTLIDKYPSSVLIDKLKNHLERVNGELKKFQDMEHEGHLE